jgi:prolyl-tRNA synthetase
MMGGKVAHEFMYVTDIGEDSLILCGNCGYSANREIAQFVKTPVNEGAPKPLEKVHTPASATIEELSKFLGIEKRQTAKIVFYMGNYGEGNPARLLVCLVRGDMEANETQIVNLSKAHDIRPAHPEEIAAAGGVAGFASPIGINREKALVIVDDLVANSVNLVTGANETDYHYLNSNCRRDYQADIIGNIALAFEGAPCAACGQPLKLARGVEVGNIFQLGTRYSEALNANYLDEKGQSHPIVMGSYGIGAGRLLASLAEAYHDEYGLTLPVSVAPFQVNLVWLKGDDSIRETAEKLYNDLRNAGVEVLYDDREVSAGIKFNDADLRGIPLRITVSGRAQKSGGVELKHRNRKESAIVAVEDVVKAVKREIAALFQNLDEHLKNALVWKEI